MLLQNWKSKPKTQSKQIYNLKTPVLYQRIRVVKEIIPLHQTVNSYIVQETLYRRTCLKNRFWCSKKYWKLEKNEYL